MTTTHDASRPHSRPCTCNALLGVHDFRSSRAYAAWLGSGRCQWCQDLAVLTGRRDDAANASPWPVRRGAIVAHGPEGLEDIVFLPFLFGTTGLVEWDPRYTLRVGSAGKSIEPMSAFTLMNSDLQGHWWKVFNVSSLKQRACSRALRHFDLLIGEDMDVLDELVSACPALQGPGLVLHSVGLTHPVTGAPMSPVEFTVSAELDPSYDPRIESPPDPLRQCAWLGAILLLRPSPDSLSLLEQIIAASLDPDSVPHARGAVPADDRFH